MNKFTPSELQYVFGQILQCPLTTLTFHHNFLSDFSPEQLRAIFGEIAKHSHLVSLIFIDEYLGSMKPKQLEAIFETIENSPLVHLGLKHDYFGTDTDMIKGKVSLCGRTTPDEREALKTVFKIIPRLKITSLDLSNNYLGNMDTELTHIMCAGISPQLQVLNLSNNYLGKMMFDPFEILFNGIARLQLKHLNLSFNSFYDNTPKDEHMKRTELISQALTKLPLKEFFCDHCLDRIPTEALKVLFQGIESCSLLESLNLAYADIFSDSTITATEKMDRSVLMSATLSRLPLVQLNLNGNGLGCLQLDSLDILIKGIASCARLNVLSLEFNDFYVKGVWQDYDPALEDENSRRQGLVHKLKEILPSLTIKLSDVPPKGYHHAEFIGGLRTKKSGQFVICDKPQQEPVEAKDSCRMISRPK